MSRSVRKRPYAPWCGGVRSQKQDKQLCNRIMRRSNKTRLAINGDEAAFLCPDEALDVWSMNYDGSRHYSPYDPTEWGTRGYWRWWQWAKMK